MLRYLPHAIVTAALLAGLALIEGWLVLSLLLVPVVVLPLMAACDYLGKRLAGPGHTDMVVRGGKFGAGRPPTLQPERWQDLVELIDLALAGQPERAKLRAWIRDNRLMLEAEEGPLHGELLDLRQLVLDLHSRHHVSSADSLWGTIDDHADRIREKTRQ